MAYGVEAFVLRTAKRSWTPAYASAQTNQDVTSLAVATSAPTQGSGYISCANSNVAKILVHGNGTEDTQVVLRLWTVSETHSNHTTKLYIPSYICKTTWTLGTLSGSGVGTAVPSGHDFCDSVQLDQGDTSIRLITDTENNAASITVDLEGASWLYLGFDDGSSTITDYNALVALF
tara:strand:+ start:2917 stop:3444 length:528 start_codon:yes stop_codon:yes gene_type:complete